MAKSNNSAPMQREENLEAYSCRLDPATWERLKKAAERVRRETGKNETPSGLIRRAVAVALGQIENHGDILVTY